jgi:hypothetical protein
MDVRIKKGNHYSSWKFPKFYVNNLNVSKNIIFTDSCKYDLGSEDQYDINKLFGIGYFPWHHYNSVRFGWRYNIANNNISIFSYWYHNKIRNYELMGSVELNDLNFYLIQIKDNQHELIVLNRSLDIVMEHVVDVPPKSIGYYLKPFFGGNKPAPHDITIKIY